MEDINKTKKWKSARMGVIIMVILHWFIMVIITSAFAKPSFYSGAPAILSYFISRWIIQERIKHEKTIMIPFFFGFAIALAIFIIQLILGTILVMVTK